MHFLCLAVLLLSQLSYVSSSSEDLGEDDSGQTISTVVQCGYGKFQHSILVLYRAQIQQAANTGGEKVQMSPFRTFYQTHTVGLEELGISLRVFCSLTTETGHISLVV